MSNFSEEVHKIYTDTISKYEVAHRHVEGRVSEISKNRDKSGVKTPLKVESIKLGREDTELGRDDAR